MAYIVSQDPSDSKSSRLHVDDIFWFFFYSFEVYSSMDSCKMIGDSPEVSNFNQLVFSNSTASSITKGHFTHEPRPCNGEDP
jgi:hypothetical protein